MSAKFVVKQFYSIGGVSAIVAGVIRSGHIREGAVGITAKGKKFTVVKIEKNGYSVPGAREGDKINISVKYLIRTDVRMGEFFQF